MRGIIVLLLLLLLGGVASATVPGSQTMAIWNPASYEWDITPVLTRLNPVTNIGYAILYTDAPAHYEEQGDVVAQYVRDYILGSDRGILMFTGLHGHGHPDGLLVAVYGDVIGEPDAAYDNREADLATMNAMSNVYEAFDNYFYGITIKSSGARGQFSNNTTLVFDDGCNGLGFIDGLGATSYAGWSSTVGLDAANDETTSLFSSMCDYGSNLRVATQCISMESGGDLTLKLAENLAAEFFGAKYVGPLVPTFMRHFDPLYLL